MLITEKTKLGAMARMMRILTDRGIEVPVIPTVSKNRWSSDVMKTSAGRIKWGMGPVLRGPDKGHFTINLEV